jgi:hypothetical protein
VLVSTSLNPTGRILILLSSFLYGRCSGGSVSRRNLFGIKTHRRFAAAPLHRIQWLLGGGVQMRPAPTGYLTANRERATLLRNRRGIGESVSGRGEDWVIMIKKRVQCLPRSFRGWSICVPFLWLAGFFSSTHAQTIPNVPTTNDEKVILYL